VKRETETALELPSVRTLFILLLLAAQAPAPQEVPVGREPKHHLVLENQYTRVYQVEVPAGEATLLHRHDHDYVYVVLGDAYIRNEVAGRPPVDQQVKDGDVNFAPGGFAHVARNLGSTPFRNVTIEVLRKSHSSAIGSADTPSTGSSFIRAIVVNTDAVEATKAEIAPGGSTPLHRHDTDHMVVAISDLHLKNNITGKGTFDIQEKAGDVVWVKGGFEHTLTNVGPRPARFLALEFH
jgi:quercetin dioxygenase-like cupin family protein